MSVLVALSSLYYFLSKVFVDFSVMIGQMVGMVSCR
jgi:hypothetical protein